MNLNLSFLLIQLLLIPLWNCSLFFEVNLCALLFVCRCSDVHASRQLGLGITLFIKVHFGSLLQVFFSWKSCSFPAPASSFISLSAICSFLFSFRYFLESNLALRFIFFSFRFFSFCRMDSSIWALSSLI